MRGHKLSSQSSTPRSNLPWPLSIWPHSSPPSRDSGTVRHSEKTSRSPKLATLRTASGLCTIWAHFSQIRQTTAPIPPPISNYLQLTTLAPRKSRKVPMPAVSTPKWARPSRCASTPLNPSWRRKLKSSSSHSTWIVSQTACTQLSLIGHCLPRPPDKLKLP